MAIAPELAVMLVAPAAVIASVSVTDVPLKVKASTLVLPDAVVIVPASVTLTDWAEPPNVFKTMLCVPLSRSMVPLLPVPVNEFTLFVATPFKLAVPPVAPRFTVNSPDVVNDAV